MASERQIKANRRNAGNSTGPRSASGKKRAGRNAFRHGLSSSTVSSAGIAKRVDKLARKIAGGAKSELVLQHAYDAAKAEFELERVRKVRIMLIERVLALGAVEPPIPFGSLMKSLRHLKLVLAGKATLPIDALATMPSVEPARSAEALRRALPDLIKLDRYERRAVSRRDRAISQIIRSKAKQAMQF
jgi:hypothetical protein